MSHKLIIWGASEHARVVADAVVLQGRYELVGFVDDNPDLWGKKFYDVPVLGGKEFLTHQRHAGASMLVLGIGNCARRLDMAEEAHALGFELATVIHPSAVLACDVTVGEGSVILAGVVVNPSAKIGQNVILNTACTVDHDCLIEDGVHLSPGVHLGGGVKVGRGSWIGIGAIVLDHLTIGPASIVGGGAVVVKDIVGGVVAYGVPARVVRSIEE